MISQSQLKEILHYDPLTGVFTWLVDRGPRKKGSIAGSRRKDGYILIGINQKVYLAHRLAFLYITGKWPKEFMDHINKNPSENSWDNLREATRSQNSHNTGKRKINKSGFKGVHWSKSSQKWHAQLYINKKRYT